MNLSNPDPSVVSALSEAIALRAGCRSTDLLQGTRGTKAVAHSRTILYLAVRMVYPYASMTSLGRVLGRDRKTVRTGSERASDDPYRSAVAASVARPHLGRQ